MSLVLFALMGIGDGSYDQKRKKKVRPIYAEKAAIPEPMFEVSPPEAVRS